MKRVRELLRKPKPSADDLGEGDQAYGLWKRSWQRQNAQWNRLVEEIVAGILAIAAILLGASAVPRSPAGSYDIHAVPLAAAGGLALASVSLTVFLWWRYMTTRRDYLDDKRREFVYTAIDSIRPEYVQQLIKLNQRRMDQYHQMTLSEAAVAWRSCQIAMSVGLLVLLAGVVVELTAASSSTSQVVTGSLAAVGSGISGYISATFLRARRQSLDQLNHYFRQPVTTSYLLTAERLITRGEDDSSTQQERNALAEEIVKRAFDVPTDDPPH